MRLHFFAILLFAAGCTEKRGFTFDRFSELSLSETRVPAAGETCNCDIPASGRIEIRLSYTGRHLVGRADILPGNVMRRACLVPGPSIVIQKNSWNDQKPCMDFPPGIAALQLPDMQPPEKAHFEFVFRGPPRDASRGWAAFVTPLLFNLDCPSACRMKAARWPVTVSLAKPPENLLFESATRQDAASSLSLSWEEPYPRAALVFRSTGYSPARLDAGTASVEGFTDMEAKPALARLQAFAGTPGASPFRRRVVFDPHIEEIWGIQEWRFVSGQNENEAILAEVSSALPVWTHAPIHAREGAVMACALPRMETAHSARKRTSLHEAYQNWVRLRAADPTRSPPPPASYWALLFAGILQSSAQGLNAQDCARLTAEEPVLSFHEVLARLQGRIPRAVLKDPPVPSVRLMALIPRADSTELQLFNDSEISFWVPILYKTSETTRNHWVFVKGKPEMQRIILQQTGKPVDLLIDPDHVSLALPFGWTREGPPEDLDGPPAVLPEN